MNRLQTSQILLMLVLLLLISGCALFANTGNRTASSSLVTPSCPQHAPITGTITRVISGTFRNLSDRGAILVDGAKKQLQGLLSRLFYLSIIKGTQILEQEGNACRWASFASLKVGQHIQAQLVQPTTIDLSNPPIILADKLVILLFDKDIL